ncbi:cysteine peptidase family C39 domain-containing protein [Rosenbergiella nectarea]|uniref:cysteine peptidase family C39 domain-containing protein n=1 Tax=Rosenbergiella nectarea TaxID=988801 RepID=UPI001F4F7F13|nr:cysteine peptidase family C39 domain-containing protein [Rosenbergiella nectarea]
MDEIRQLFKRVCQQLQFGFFRKVPQVLQTEAAECGLACIVMVCRYFGMNIDLLNLRQKFGLSTQGATLATLVHIGSQLNLQTRALSLDLEEIRQLKRPCLLHWDMSHFVVLVKAGRNKFTLHDPAFGRRVVSLQEMSQHFTGIALELWPDSEFKPIKARSRISFLSLLKNISGLPSVLTKIFALTILVEAVNIAIPVGTQLVMDHVIIARDRDLLTLICLGLVSFILFRTFISMLRSWTSLVMQSLIDVQWKTGLLAPDSGTIRFNGLDITQVGLNNFREVIACVLQEDKLFAGSIAENITGFGEENNRERIIECATLANLHDEIISMPMGYETLVSELGGSLSGGQKQRLLIARALYRRPAILFLDEATSHLDLENESAVNAAIRSLNITRIFIAHRPSTIASADRIIDLTPQT